MIISLFDANFIVPYRQHYRSNEIWRMYADSTRAREILGWVPEISLKQEMKRNVEWFATNYIDKFK
jgi:nucleoside-diphosphate-sugar epimerase